MSKLSLSQKECFSGWLTAVQKTLIDFDLEKTPLEIKTDSHVGSGTDFQLNFFSNSEEKLGGIRIRLNITPLYRILECSRDQPGNSTTLSSDSSNIWRITLKRMIIETRVTIHCNNEEVLNVVLSNTVCDRVTNWGTTWGTHVTKIKFSSTHDVTDYYRAYTPGNI